MAFGLLLGLIGCAVAGIEGIQRDIEDTQERNWAKKYNKLTYLDSYGREHLTSNGRLVTTTTLPFGGDLVIQDIKTGKIYYNLSQMKKDQMPKKTKELYRRGSNRFPAGFEVLFYCKRKLPEYVGVCDVDEFVEIYTPWNNEEMDRIFKEKNPSEYTRKNEEMRQEYNERMYRLRYGDEYDTYKKETSKWDMKFEDYIRMKKYPTLEEFIKKYNL